MKISNALEIDRKKKLTQFYQKADVIEKDAVLADLKGKRAALYEKYLHSVLELCADFFQHKIDECVPLATGGTFHLLYKVSFFSRDSVIVRVSPPELALHACEFLIDLWVYELLKIKKLPTLSVHVVDLSKNKYPFDFEIIAYAPGECLTKLSDPATQKLPKGVLSSLGAFLARLHQVTVKGFGPLDIARLDYKKPEDIFGIRATWKDFIFSQFDEHLAICHQIKAITTDELETIVSLFEKYVNLFDITDARLLHGDPGNHNLFALDNKISAVIDWEDALGGDPIFELASWGTFFRPHFLPEVLEGYQAVTPLPKDLELRYWLYYLRIALCKTVVRHRFGYKDHPDRPPASQRIQRALEALDN